jgi:hypothetical protein
MIKYNISERVIIYAHICSSSPNFLRERAEMLTPTEEVKINKNPRFSHIRAFYNSRSCIVIRYRLGTCCTEQTRWNAQCINPLTYHLQHKSLTGLRSLSSY